MPEVDYAKGRILFRRIIKSERIALGHRWEFGKWCESQAGYATYAEMAHEIGCSTTTVQDHVKLVRVFPELETLIERANDTGDYRFKVLIGKQRVGAGRHDLYSLTCEHCQSTEILCQNCGGRKFFRAYARTISETFSFLVRGPKREKKDKERGVQKFPTEEEKRVIYRPT